MGPDFRFALVSKDEKTDPYPYVYIENDGSFRELSSDERQYLQEAFHPGDGGRPYVKASYRSRTPTGRLGGFLRRSSLPPALSTQTSADRARIRRARARWTFAALFLAYFPVTLGLSRWLPSLANAGWYVWASATVIASILSLHVDWPRRNFQVREPDRRDQRSTLP
jgi:hypothetical protein